MSKIFGLPAHPFMVHLPVVLLPIAAILAVIAIIRPAFRAKYGAAIAAVTLVAFFATFFARQSGEQMYQLMNRGPNVDKHKSLANTTTILTFLFSGFFIVLVFGKRVSVLKNWQSWLVPALRVLVGVTAVLAAIWMARTGHEGARLNWNALSGQG